MQRSRRALLQRRAAALESEKRGKPGGARLLSVSVSLVVSLWGFIFLPNFLIGLGNDYTEVMNTESGECKWHEVQPDPTTSSDSREPLAVSVMISGHTVQSCPVSEEKALGNSQGEFVPGDEKNPLTSVTEQLVDNFDSPMTLERGTLLKSDKSTRVAPPGLDEFKSRAIAAREKPLSNQKGTVINRLEPDGREYNYASSRKGAKILASNKESKGAFNILDKDMDKYLRNPCSAEDKYVVIELSEETLVDTIEIGNFEHYSSTLKDFELYSSLVYPTDSWIKLGNFTAQNVKHAQRFALSDPEWARYLKLNMLSHYGSEFYCTLSVVEVYGVDAVERMLEDLISAETKRLEPEEENNAQMLYQGPPSEDDLHQDFSTEISRESSPVSSNQKKEVSKSTVPNPVSEGRPAQVGRVPGDTVLKILLQKVQSLDLNFSVLERYLDELNNRYAHIFKDFDDDLSNNDMILEKNRLEIKNLQNSQDMFNKELGELHSWKSLVSLQLEQLAKDNIMLRSEFERVRGHQVDMEHRGLVVILMSFVFGCLAAAKLFVGVAISTFKTQNSTKFCTTSSAWFFLLLSSSIIALVLAI